MDRGVRKTAVLDAALAAGFSSARILAPCADRSPEFRGAASLLVTALPYPGGDSPPGGPGGSGGGRGSGDEAVPERFRVRIAPFARRNYYRGAVRRLRRLGAEFRARFGGSGVRGDYRVFCNSQVPEKELAVASGLGFPGRNGLVITAEAGSQVILAAMTLPFELESDGPSGGGEGPFPLCLECARAPGGIPCAAACPTGAIGAEGGPDRERCVQWYLSGGDLQRRDSDPGRFPEPRIPPGVAAAWGRRLYGCTSCQDVCPHNRARMVAASAEEEGPLPPWLDGRELLALDDVSLKERFRGTALGMGWLGAEVIRRSLQTALAR